MIFERPGVSIVIATDTRNKEGVIRGVLWAVSIGLKGVDRGCGFVDSWRMQLITRDQALMSMILVELKEQNERYGAMNDKCMRVIDMALDEVEEDGATPSRTVKRMATSLVTSMMKLKLDTLRCLIAYEKLMAEKKRRGEEEESADALGMARQMMEAFARHGLRDGEVVEEGDGFVADCEVSAESEAEGVPSE